MPFLHFDKLLLHYHCRFRNKTFFIPGTTSDLRRRDTMAATSSGGEGGASYPFYQHDLSAMSIEERAAFWVEKCDKRAQDPFAYCRIKSFFLDNDC